MKVIPAIVYLDFPEFGAKSIAAKLDTGAYSGSFHATKISVLKNRGQDELQFSPFDHPELVYTTKHFVTKYVKSSNGQIEKRYFIDTDIILEGIKYPIRLSIANRSSMKWPVLIGRKFLKNNKFLVDVSK